MGAFHRASKEEIANVLTLAAKFEEFFGSKIIFADKAIMYPNNMIHGNIPLPTREARDTAKNWLRLHNYWVHLSVYKVDSMPQSSYMVNFSRRMDKREYRHREWLNQLELDKIFVHGNTPEEAFEAFLNKFEDSNAEDLGGFPYTLVQEYRDRLVTKAE